jgi:small subunit ribosomal protein S16
VAVKIKLKRLGKIREPYYRIIVADARTKRDGRAIEEIGKYHPKAEPSFIEVNSERVQHWLSVGAQPTDPVRVLLKITGDWQKFKGEPGSEGTLRTAEPRADKKERFETAAKESQATKEAKEDKGSRAGTQSRATKPARDASAKESAAKDAPAKESAAKKEAPAKEGKSSASPAAAAPDEGTGGQARAADAPSGAETTTATAADAPSGAETTTADAATPADGVTSADAATPADVGEWSLTCLRKPSSTWSGVSSSTRMTSRWLAERCAGVTSLRCGCIPMTSARSSAGAGVPPGRCVP